MLKNKLTTPDLKKLRANVQLDVTEKLSIGNVKLESEHFTAELMMPYDFVPENKYTLMLKYKPYSKAGFTYSDKELVAQVKNLTQSGQHDRNFNLFDSAYQVFIRPGVVIQLSLEEVGELTAIFSAVEKYLPESLKEGFYSLD